MRKKIMLMLCALVIILWLGNVSVKKKINHFTEEPVFWVLSDTHLIAPSLHDEGEEFQRIKATAAGKELDYQVDSLTALVDQALIERPTGIIITGDLTLNGEKKSAEKLAEILEPLREAGIKYYVIPGNHDVHDGWAREFKGNTAVKTSQISPKDFEKIFNWSYEGNSSKDKQSLSYVVPVNDSLQLIMLDSNIYGKLKGTTVPQTKGRLNDETFTWLEEQLKRGKEEKIESVVFMHHNLLQHNLLINEGFVIEESDKMKSLLADYQVPLVFSGHTHAQSIKQDSQTNISEIVTASYSITEQIYGEVRLSPNKITYEKKQIDVDNWAQKNQKKDEALLNYRDYTKQLFIEDGKKLAYVQLIEGGIYDEEALDLMAEFVGEANWRYFTGNKELTEDSVNQLKQQEGYQLIKDSSEFLLEYMDSIIELDERSNNQLEIVLEPKK